jgi:uncharacterized protein
MTETKQELRKRGEELLRKREERLQALRVARGLPQAKHEVATLEREVRSIGVLRALYHDDGEVRAGGMKTLSGVGCCYRSWSQDLGQFREQVLPGAFTRSIASGQNVDCLRDHDDALLLGRTSSKTLTLSDSTSALGFSCPLPDTVVGRDVQTMCERGDLHQCSFAFSQADDDWDRGSDGMMYRTIRAAILHDVSVVANPAYLAPSCSVRTLAEDQEMALRKLIVALHRQRKPIPAEITRKLATYTN